MSGILDKSYKYFCFIVLLSSWMLSPIWVLGLIHLNLEVYMDSTGKFFAFIGVCVTLFLSVKGIQGMIKEREDEIQEARDNGMRSAQKVSS